MLLSLEPFHSYIPGEGVSQCSKSVDVASALRRERRRSGFSAATLWTLRKDYTANVHLSKFVHNGPSLASQWHKFGTIDYNFIEKGFPVGSPISI